MPQIFLAMLLAMVAAVKTYANQEVVIAYGHNYKPFAWVENHQLIGMHVDILEELLGNRLKLSLSHQRFPWKRAQWQLKTGKADALLTALTSSRAEYSVASEPIITVEYKLYTYADHPRLAELRAVSAIKQLVGFTAVEYLGANTEDMEAAQVTIEYVPEIESALKFVANKRADLFYDSPLVIQPLIRQLGLQGYLIELPHTLHRTQQHLLISKQSPLLEQMPLIDKVIKAMKQDGTLQRIKEKYR